MFNVVDVTNEMAKSTLDLIYPFLPIFIIGDGASNNNASQHSNPLIFLKQ